MRIIISIFICCITLGINAQSLYQIKFTFTDSINKLSGVEVKMENPNRTFKSLPEGDLILQLKPGNYSFIFFKEGYHIIRKELELKENVEMNIVMTKLSNELDEVIIRLEDKTDFSIGRLNDVEGTNINAGKKNDVIFLEKVNGNLSTNNSRQIYSKVVGLNIWESDAAGLQIGIGGRGLSPNRTSNFNTRQNGYDMSADALGYPESYYNPPSESIERIEILRGASSLQYGTQFGGVVNFVTKKGNKEKPFEFLTRQTFGSFGLYNTFNSIGGTIKKRFNYYSFYQYKKGDGWRENSNFKQHTAYLGFSYFINEKLEISGDYTFMTYLSKQPGGLTDAMFEDDPQQSIRDRNWFQVNWNLFSVVLNYKINNQWQLNSRTFGLIAQRQALGFLGSINRADPNLERELIRGDFNNIGNETRLLHRYPLKKSLGVLLLGTRLYKGKTFSKQGNASIGSDADFNFNNPDDIEHSNYTFPSFNAAFFAENIFYINEKLSFTPGVRIENITTSSAGYYKERNLDLAGNVIFEQTNYTSSKYSRYVPLGGIGISYKRNKCFESYANISQNYRAINFSDVQIVNPNSRVDPNIQDENGFNTDLGIRGCFKNWLTYDVSVFLLQYNNRIGEILKVDESNYTIYRYRTNIADSRNRGVELFMEADLVKLFSDSSKHSFKLFFNGSLIKANYLDSEQSAVAYKKVELVPEQNIKAGCTYSYKTFSFNFQYTYVSQQFTDATNAMNSSNAIYGIIPAYSIMDIGSSYTYKRFKCELGINNLLNQSYFTRRAISYPGPGIMPSEVRNFYFTIQVKI